MQNQLTPSEKFFTDEYQSLEYFLTPFNTLGNTEYLSDEELVIKFVKIDAKREPILTLGRKVLKENHELLGEAIAHIIYRTFPGGSIEARAWFKSMLDLLEEEMKKQKK